jgi:hypothetical protein
MNSAISIRNLAEFVGVEQHGARVEPPMISCAFLCVLTGPFDDGKRIATVEELTVNEKVKV